MKQDNEFDKLLDDALSEYRNAEPLAGIDDRVLCRLEAQAERRRGQWWRWSPVAAAVALVAVAVWFGLSTDVPRGTISAPTAQKHAPAAQPQATAPQYGTNGVVKAAHSPKRHASRAMVVAARREPMREQFPVPAPLSRQERALLELARTDPALLESLQQSGTTTDIAPITIKPLAEIATSTEGEN